MPCKVLAVEYCIDFDFCGPIKYFSFESVLYFSLQIQIADSMTCLLPLLNNWCRIPNRFVLGLHYLHCIYENISDINLFDGTFYKMCCE